jgi:glycerol-3-phosphate dehydrogenase (NAD(P)+)
VSGAGSPSADAAAGHIFAEVWRYAEQLGARPESMIGLAGTGDLVATALAPQSRNRRAGELLARGATVAAVGRELGQISEALDLLPLLDRAMREAGIKAPATVELARIVESQRAPRRSPREQRMRAGALA